MQKCSKKSKIKYSLSNKSGAAYLISITTLLVGMILIFALLRSSGEFYFIESKNSKIQGAQNLAEAGIDYGFWCIHYDFKSPPLSRSINTATGRFEITIEDDGNRDPSTILITSTGFYKKNKKTLKRVVMGPLPYYYAWCENVSIVDNNKITITGTIGGMRTNGSINLTNTQTNISSGGWATGSKYGQGVVNPIYTDYPPIRFPLINWSYYTSLSPAIDDNLDLSNKLNGTYFPSKNALICVDGDVIISGQYDGIYTIVSNGVVDVECPVKPQNANSYLAVISTDTINIWAADGMPYDNTRDVATGIFYAKKTDNTGKINIYRYRPTGKTTIIGSIASDDIFTMCWEDDEPKVKPINVDLLRDNRINLTIMRQLKLPSIE